MLINGGIISLTHSSAGGVNRGRREERLRVRIIMSASIAYQHSEAAFEMSIVTYCHADMALKAAFNVASHHRA